jgi:hypothetical protein
MNTCLLKIRCLPGQLVPTMPSEGALRRVDWARPRCAFAKKRENVTIHRHHEAHRVVDSVFDFARALSRNLTINPSEACTVVQRLLMAHVPAHGVTVDNGDLNAEDNVPISAARTGNT